MPEDLDDLEGRILRLSDDELVQMIITDSDKFTQREIVFAEEELRDRGFQLEQHRSDLKIITPDSVESTHHKTAIYGMRDGSDLRIITPDRTELAPRKTVIGGGLVGPIIRDIIIVWVLTAVGGFVIGVVTSGLQLDVQKAMLALMVSNLVLGTVAFTIAGCLAPPNRWRHLGFVAFGAWFTSLINVVFFGGSISQWIGGAIFTAIIMGIGGAISHVFKRDTKPSA
jgi:hypothetical protein